MLPFFIPFPFILPFSIYSADGIRLFFLERGSLLIWYSSLAAADFEPASSAYTNVTGLRDLVYRAPSLAELWAAILFSRSLVIPVYKVPSLQRTM